MDGNFRIVQRSENDFIIEKEFETERAKWALWPFKTIKEKYWCLVDHRGQKYSLGSIFIREQKSIFQYSSFETAVRVLEKIKKFPIAVYPGPSENNIPAHRTPPTPPPPSEPRTVNESKVPNKENDPFRKRDKNAYTVFLSQSPRALHLMEEGIVTIRHSQDESQDIKSEDIRSFLTVRANILEQLEKNDRESKAIEKKLVGRKDIEKYVQLSKERRALKVKLAENWESVADSLLNSFKIDLTKEKEEPTIIKGI